MTHRPHTERLATVLLRYLRERDHVRLTDRQSELWAADLVAGLECEFKRADQAFELLREHVRLFELWEPLLEAGRSERVAAELRKFLAVAVDAIREMTATEERRRRLLGEVPARAGGAA